MPKLLTMLRNAAPSNKNMLFMASQGLDQLDWMVYNIIKLPSVIAFALTGVAGTQMELE